MHSIKRKRQYRKKYQKTTNKKDTSFDYTYSDNEREDFDILSKRYRYEMVFSKDLLLLADKLLKKYCLQNIDTDFSKRIDLRNEIIFTIDGDDAKDFDDAVSVKKKKGGYEIGVHIADVSHFIAPKNPLEIEASKRATSLYLLDRVIPMFPESISNQLCSLVENEPRLTFSCFITIDFSGKICNYFFKKTIIQNKRRSTYREVEEVLKGKKSLGIQIDNSISLLNEIKNILHQKRLSEGSINFELKEQEFSIHQEKLTGLQLRKRLTSEMIIEELMLLANQCSAELMVKNRLGIYRVHEIPSKRDLALFENLVYRNGFHFPPNKSVINPLKKKGMNKYQSFLNSLKDVQFKKLFSFLLLTSMKKAEYSENCLGHYGLAFQKYCHFTSPIRRYPDLIAHYIIGNIIGESSIPINKREIKYIAKQSSIQERKSVDSEREYKKVKIIRYLKEKKNYRFIGIVVKTIRRGIFVQEEKTGIEGFINTYTLMMEDFRFDQINQIFTNDHSSKRYRLGDKIEVSICNLSLEKMYIDSLEIV